MSESSHPVCTSRNTAGVSSGTYGLAFLGSAFYFLQHATSFGDGVIGLLKSIVWPAYLVYKALEFLVGA